MTSSPDKSAIYGLSYPDARFFVFDVATRRTRDLGDVTGHRVFSGPERDWREEDAQGHAGPHPRGPVSATKRSTVRTDFGVVPYRAEDEQTLWLEVLDWLERYRDHDPDWADGYLAVVSGRERRAKVWTFDREFRTIWRRPDGKAIPLAVA
jgi:hypothetical protein